MLEIKNAGTILSQNFGVLYHGGKQVFLYNEHNFLFISSF